MKTTQLKEALKSEIRKILKEEMNNSEQKWIVYFTTPSNPDPEDAEGWISVGANQDEAKENLMNFFDSNGRQKTKFYRVQVSPVEGDSYYVKYQDKPKFTQIQETLSEMARIAKTLKIADKDAAQQVIEKFKGTKKAWIADMITKTLEAGDEGIAQVALAKAIGKVDEFGDGRQQAINPEVRSLLGAGVFTFGEAGTKSEPATEPEVNEPVSTTKTPEPEEEEIPEPEDDEEEEDIKDEYEKPEEEDDEDEELFIKKTGPSKLLSTKTSELDVMIKDMKKLASDYKKAQLAGDEDEAATLVAQLKEKKKQKAQLEREIAKAIGDDEEDEDI